MTGADRCAGLCEADIDSHSPEEGAFPRHVGSGHEQHLSEALKGEVVGHARRMGDQRMTEIASGAARGCPVLSVVGLKR